MTRKIIFGIIIIVIVLAFLWFWGTKEKQKEQFSTIEAQELARQWIENNAPTYVFDGESLELLNQEEIIENSLYSFVFQFKSRGAGYGDRSGQIIAQVITDHTIEIVIDNKEVIKAVTDEIYSELDARMITKPKEDTLMNVSLFFGRDEELTKVEREVTFTQAIARTALTELIAGPTEQEKQEGYYSLVNSETEIQELSIENGVAYVDFSSHLERGVAGSATVSFIRDQIEKTLESFVTINSVVISIDGRVDDILQP
jgi:spore germination protein GerM